MEQVGDRVTVVGVAWAGTDEEMRSFVERHGVSFPTLVDDDGSLFAHFGVPAQPAWVFVSSDGSADRRFGAQPDDELRAALDALA